MDTPETVDWRAQFFITLSALSWAVGKLGPDESGYAGVIHKRLTEPSVIQPPTSGTKWEHQP